MKQSVYLLLFFSLTFNLKAQNTENIAGKWIFTEVLNENIDEASYTYLENEVIGKWEFHFLADGSFETTMMEGHSDGNWTYDAANKTITIIDKNGGTQEFKILKSSKDSLALNLGKGQFLLKRLE